MLRPVRGATARVFQARISGGQDTEHRKATEMKRIVLLVIASIAVVAAFGTLTGCGGSDVVAAMTAKTRFRVATTTSLYDTGLWGHLEPKFEEKYGVELDIMYAGTGKALEFGRRGDVDAVAVHAKSSEEKFIAGGYGVARHPIAYNYFLVIGPESDPAGIKGLPPEDGFKKLMQEGQEDPGSVKFISRGDNSGTHSKEKAIWVGAGYDYTDVEKSGDWYVEAGAGMGPTLVMANEKSAYTLADIGTFLAYKKDLGLVPVIDEGDLLLNVYSVIAVNPDTVPGVKIDMANNLIEFLTSDEIQDLIGKYGVKDYGRELFTPCKGTSVCTK